MTTTTNRIEERILGALMGVGVGVLLGFFLQERDRLPRRKREQSRTNPLVSQTGAAADLSEAVADL